VTVIGGTAMILGTASASPVVSAWGSCIDIGGRHSGVVSAIMNTSGQVAGVLSPVVLALVVDRFAGWRAPLYAMGVLYLAGAVCWALIDPRKVVEA
jgi:ACS family glucarate transporter-like MFS transporter